MWTCTTCECVICWAWQKGGSGRFYHSTTAWKEVVARLGLDSSPRWQDKRIWPQAVPEEVQVGLQEECLHWIDSPGRYWSHHAWRCLEWCSVPWPGWQGSVIGWTPRSQRSFPHWFSVNLILHSFRFQWDSTYYPKDR